MSLISLCRIEGKPPLGQLSVLSDCELCSTDAMGGRVLWPPAMSQACSGIMYHGMPLWGGQPHVWLLVGLTASSMNFSLRLTSQPSVGCCLFGWQVQRRVRVRAT